MRPYELMLLIDASLEEPREEVNKVEEVVRSLGGEVSKTDVWGRKKLAYPIQKQTEGFYSVTQMSIEQEALKELERLLKLRQDVWRHMIIRLDEE